MIEPRPDHGGLDPFAGIVVTLGAAGLVSALVTWSAAQLCLLLTGAGWQHAPFVHSPTLVVELVRSHDVRRAWGSAYPDADSLTHPWLFWMFVILMVVAQ